MPGIELAAKHLMRLGVALLGLRITLGQIAALGWFPVLLVVGSVVAIMAVGLLLAHWLGLSDHATGIFLGATIHDVAQVVGAGYGVSTEAGDTATVIKLMRVAMLMPVILVIAAVNHRHRSPDQPPAVLLPWFVVAFCVLMVVGSLGWVPRDVQHWGNDLSRWCLVIAISAIGIKTRLQDLATVGIKPIALMVGETVFLAALVLLALHLTA